MLFLLLACDDGEGKVEEFAAADDCSLTAADGNPECPLDPCADRCASVEEGLACCIDTYGFGEPGTVAAEDSIFCGVEVDYDASAFLSEAAALCAAQVQGFEPGISTCFAQLAVCDDGADWMIENTLSETCGSSTGHLVVVDAATGILGPSSASVFNDGICDE